MKDEQNIIDLDESNMRSTGDNEAIGGVVTVQTMEYPNFKPEMKILFDCEIIDIYSINNMGDGNRGHLILSKNGVKSISFINIISGPGAINRPSEINPINRFLKKSDTLILHYSSSRDHDLPSGRVYISMRRII